MTDILHKIIRKIICDVVYESGSNGIDNTNLLNRVSKRMVGRTKLKGYEFLTLYYATIRSMIDDEIRIGLTLRYYPISIKNMWLHHLGKI